MYEYVYTVDDTHIGSGAGRLNKKTMVWRGRGFTEGWRGSVRQRKLMKQGSSGNMVGTEREVSRSSTYL